MDVFNAQDAAEDRLAGDRDRRRARVSRSAESQQGHLAPRAPRRSSRALDKTEKDKADKAAIDQLDAVAKQVEQDAASASGADADAPEDPGGLDEGAGREAARLARAFGRSSAYRRNDRSQKREASL